MTVVLVTRTAPGAHRTLGRLAQDGFDPISAITAEIQPRPVEWPDDVAALALTSPNGAVRAGELAPDKSLPVFAVGDATAEAAQTVGFSDVVSASGDGAALAALIVNPAAPGRCCICAAKIKRLTWSQHWKSRAFRP
jgi:uroporphyrinogen-III synthase